MLVVHALWSENAGLCVWAEQSVVQEGQPARVHKGSRAPLPRPHPFAASAMDVHAALTELGGIQIPEPDERVRLTVLLPTVRNRPQPSPKVLLEEEVEDGEPHDEVLAPWIVPACVLSPLDAVDVLLSLPPGTTPTIRLGDSLRVLAEACRLALEVVARGSVLPVLLSQDGMWFARWKPVFHEVYDQERLRLLAEALPPMVRAELATHRLEVLQGEADEKGWEAYVPRSADVVVREAMETLTDSAVRLFLRHRELLPPVRGRAPATPPAAEAWIVALTQDDPWVDAEDDTLAPLQAELDTWIRPIAVKEQTSFRTCFRLQPPPVPEGATPADTRLADASWEVEFLLQATDDPSLVIPAEQVWRTRTALLTHLHRVLANPQEHLLRDLGRASRLYPHLEKALRTPRPSGMRLDAVEAWRFLKQAVPVLDQAGFGVLVPLWWRRSTARLGVRMKVAMARGSSVGFLGMEGLCTFQWSLSLGGEQLTLEELKALAALKQPLVQLRGQWVELRPDEIAQAVAFFEREGTSGEMPLSQVLRLGLGLEGSPAGLPVVELEAEGELGELLRSASEQRLNPLPTPPGFVGTLRPYQERGLAWLVYLGRLGLGACLADDMGLGKTIQLLALLVAERRDAERARARRPDPTLLVCPMSVLGNWARESRRFSPEVRVHVHHGPYRFVENAFRDQVARSDLVITTYSLASRDMELLASVEWHRVVLDEAQNIKNPAAQQTRAVRKLRTRQRVALTGTPVENRLSELWSIMQFLNPGLLGTAGDFKRRFATPIERFREEEKAVLLKRITGPFILRRLKTDQRIIQDLPEKIDITVPCHLTREQATLYQAVLDDMMRQIAGSDGIQRKAHVLTTLLRLKQICNHPRQFLQDRSSIEGRSGKLARLEEVLEEAISEGDRALVFTQYAEMGHILKARLQLRLGREVLYLHGDTPAKLRDTMVARFQSDDGPPILLATLRAGGTGLNLTAANHVVHFDRWWNPAVEDQATDRAFRIGQKRNVQVRKFVCVGTLEERIDQMIREKRELADRVVGAGETWLTELSTDELKGIFALSADAVAEG